MGVVSLMGGVGGRGEVAGSLGCATYMPSPLPHSGTWSSAWQTLTNVACPPSLDVNEMGVRSLVQSKKFFFYFLPRLLHIQICEI